MPPAADSAAAKPKGGKPIQSGARLNTLGLSRNDLEVLLDQLESAPTTGGGEAAAVRSFIRRKFRQVRIPMQISQPGGSVATVAVACRNISRGGLSLLHSAYLHMGTRCTFLLPIAGGGAGGTGGAAGYATAVGRVVRCQHRRAMIHEIGIAFESPLDVRTLLGLDPLSDWFSREKVDPAELKGTLLHIEPSAADRRLIRYFVRETNLDVSNADDAAAGIQRAAAASIIVCDLAPPGMTGAEFIRELRGKGVKAPVIMLAPESADGARETMARTPAHAFLARPVAQELFLRALAEFMLGAKGAGGLGAAGGVDPGPAAGTLSAKQLADVTRELSTAASRLETMNRDGDVEGCRVLCKHLATSAGAAGFAAISAAAEAVIKALVDQKTMVPAAEALGKLIEASKATSAKLAA